MRKALIAALAAGALTVAGNAAAGGWATAGVTPPPDDIEAGGTWNAQITILQHGRTPLTNVKPTLTIRSGGTAKTFPAKPTGKPGVYTAKVKFPSSGTWSYQVYDGFNEYGGARTHTFSDVKVGPGSGGGFSLPDAPVIGAALLGLAAIAALVFLARRARPRPAPVSG